LARIDRGQQLVDAGHYQAAQQVFEEILHGLGTEPSYDRCWTLGSLGRCLRFQGRLEAAEAMLRQGLAEAPSLESSDLARKQMAARQADLADDHPHHPARHRRPGQLAGAADGLAIKAAGVQKEFRRRAMRAA
jgi:tetratricopeptide (TPR) repeat protein